MATASSVTTDWTTCPICLDVFDNPKSLPCIHGFCLKCLERHFVDICQGDEVSCPLCRTAFKIPSDGLRGLPHHFFIQHLVDAKNASSKSTGEVPCEVCLVENETSSEEVPAATVYCVDCGQKLCERCGRPHRRLAGGAHQVRQLGDKLEQELLQLRSSCCDKHTNERLKLYCYECSENICLMCSAIQHRQHKSDEIPQVADSFRPQIDDDDEQILSSIGTVRQLSERTKQQFVKFLSQVGDAEKMISETGETLKRLIDTRVSEVLVDLESVKSESSKQVNAVEDQLQLVLVAMESFHTYLRELLDKGRPSDVTRAASELHKRATELLENDVTSVQYCPPHVTFTPADVTQLTPLQLIGKLTVSRHGDKPEATCSFPPRVDESESQTSDESLPRPLDDDTRTQLSLETPLLATVRLLQQQTKQRPAATVEATKAGRRQDKVADAAAAGVKHTVLTAAVKRVDVAGCSSQQSDHDRPTSSDQSFSVEVNVDEDKQTSAPVACAAESSASSCTAAAADLTSSVTHRHDSATSQSHQLTADASRHDSRSCHNESVRESVRFWNINLQNTGKTLTISVQSHESRKRSSAVDEQCSQLLYQWTDFDVLHGVSCGQVDDDNDDVDEEEEDEEEWVTDIGLDAAAAELMTEDAGSPCSVQLLCVNDNRWVTAVSTADGAVTVYDWLCTVAAAEWSHYVNLQHQLDCLSGLPDTEDQHVEFDVCQPPDQLAGSTDGGRLMTVANALALALSQDPATEQIVLDEAKMKQHLRRCLQQQRSLRLRSSHPEMISAATEHHDPVTSQPNTDEDTSEPSCVQTSTSQDGAKPAKTKFSHFSGKEKVVKKSQKESQNTSNEFIEKLRQVTPHRRP